ncbi:MAG: hydrogenase maturation protease [Dehalococcoidia bacterium]|jgi:hydrogenase maturation protease
MTDITNIAVLGIGNPLRRDDGLGIRVITEMRDSDKYSGVEIIDGGTAPDLLSLLNENIRKLIIVDALRGGGRPGTLYRLEIHESNIPDDTPPSLHGLGVVDSLKMMQKLGIKAPEIVIVGVEPADTSHGLHLTPEITDVLPQVLSAIDRELRSSH